MANAIQILSTLEYLGPYNSGTYFGLVLQVGVGEVTTGSQDVQVTSAMAEIFQPWKWKSPIAARWWPQIQLWKYLDAGDPTTSTKSADDPIPVNVQSYDCAELRNELESDCSAAITNNHLSWIDPGQSGGSMISAGDLGYPWPAQLAQVARLPYPIPHVLRLSYLLKVNDPLFTSPDPASAYFATVTFQAKTNGATKTFTPQTRNATTAKASNGQVRLTIPYNDPILFLSTQPLTNFAPAATVISGSAPTPEINDWQAHLVAGCADLFDIPARLLGPIRSDCQTPATAASCTSLQQAIASEFSAFVTAFLTAQRNVLSYGVLTGPDESSLLSRICSQWVSQGGDVAFANTFQTVVQKQLSDDQANPDQSAVLDLWLLLLKQNPSLANNSLIGPLPDAPGRAYKSSDAYKTGQTVLYHGQLYKARRNDQLGVPSAAPADWTQVTPTLSVDPSHLSDRLAALENLQQQLAQNDVLSALILALWDNFKNIDPQKYQSFRYSATAALGNLNLRGVLLQGNLHDSWQAIVAKPSRDNLRRNIPVELKRRIATLLAAVPGVPTTPAFSAPLASAVQDWTATTIVDALVPLALLTPGANTHTTTAPQRTRTSEGLSVLLSTMDAASGPAEDAADDLRQMTGLCVLMREQSEHIWRCLNAGIPMRVAGDSATAAVTGLADPVVIALPQHTQAGLRRATLTYNNQPIMSESPAHGFSKGIVPEQKPIRDRLVSFQHPSVSRGLDTQALSRWKIPGLAFRRNYDVLIGTMSNAAALPAAFAHPTLGPAVLSFDSINAANPHPSIARIPYMRTVPVSSLRFGASGTDLAKIALPPVPPDVYPRARDASTVLPDALRDEPAPLVMLSSYGMSGAVDTFQLKIAKPTTDLATWDRWMAAIDTSKPGTDSDIRKLRSQVWERFHVFARQESSRFKTSLDDPAVRQLTITIEGVDGLTGSAATDTRTWTPPQMSPDPTPLNNVVLRPADPILLTMKVSETPPSTVFDRATWTLTVKPGTLAKITLTPGIDHTDQGLFASCIDAARLKSYSFVLETASKSIPDVQTLRSGLTISAPDGASRTTVSFLFRLSSQPNIARVDLQTQIWRWDGRSSLPYPFKEATSPPSRALLEWELEAFSSRIASDATFRPMSRTLTRANAVTFEAHDERSADPGATFYRAAVIAYNRYGSLVPVSSRSLSSVTEFASIPGADGGWTRCFVPSILPSSFKVPKPGIKFIVPLTSSPNQTQARAASVLVIVQGPWYALGGLAEEMRAHIADASPSLDFNTNFQEVGPDPILFSGQRGQLPKEYQDYSDSVPSRLHGPVGHTFDSSDVNPLWVYSSFVLDAPLAKLGAGDSQVQEGTFAAVQFKRVICRDGLASPPPNGDLESVATDPVWVQFLSSRFFPFTTAFDGLQLRINANGNASIMQASDVLTLSHGLNNDSKTEHLLFALLLTEEVPDLLGRKGQERFVDVLLQPARPDITGSLPDPGSTYACWKVGLEPRPSYIGRILAIQRQVNTSANSGVASIPLSNAQALWDEMFPPEDTSGRDTEDASSRIIAVSPPIFTSVQASCMTDTGGQR